MLKLRNRGQGMTEYILIVALVAILSITVLTVFGKQIRSLFQSSSEQIAGKSGSSAKDFSGESKDDVDKGLKDLGK